ncbi:MAG: 23S rRNA (adenine(2503)-C(2))-methyltransferase RlmN [Proteobacteria bacterium]|nr:23S rRNA (adenine(2503)-C(2))-methyltransferase RlmN [Pseudomonadota bacterium]
MNKPDLKNYTSKQLSFFVEKLGLPKYRAAQIFSWLYRPGFTDFSQMTDITKEVRALLAENAVIGSFSNYTEESSKDGTVKYGFILDDGAVIESVLIPEDDRNTLCVSSQVGCAMKCAFCLTGTLGFTRNLTPAEIINQVTSVIDKIRANQSGQTLNSEKMINNIVFMGMGEPLLNFDNLIAAIEILTDQRGLDFSQRKITVSTCGIVPKIHELGDKTNINLAVSLHATSDSVRNLLMPVNKKYPLKDLIEACRKFPLPKRRRIMFEYILLKDVNDSDDDARKLAQMLKGIPCKINLLPYNESGELPYKQPAQERVDSFQQILWDAEYTVIVRSSRGSDISAACGQLAGKSA